MNTTIINTKLHMPTAKGILVERPYLLEQLNAYKDKKLTLLSASAGFGKTTLLLQWISTVDEHVAWVALDTLDSDIYRFLTYVIAGLKKAIPTLDDTLLDVVKSAQPPSVDYILTSLINTIHAQTSNCILVLDDYHLVDNIDIDNALGFIITHMPDNFHLVISTREDPNIPLAKLRSDRQMTELRTHDLKFSINDIDIFFLKVMGIKLSQDSINALEDRTEGWIAGLQLAGVSFKNQENIEDRIQELTGNHRFILDYLVNEVLNHQTEKMREFLTHTSILRQMNYELCQYMLSDYEISIDILKTLEQSNLFVISLDDTRTWYRYHHLFADLLRQRLLLNNNDITLVNELHIKASKWYEQASNNEEAFYHATCANDIKRVLYLLNKNKKQLHKQGMNTFIINWIHSLEEKMVKEYPEVYIWQSSLMLMMGMTSGVDELLNTSEKYLDSTTNENKNLLGRIATSRATLALTRYDIPAIIKQANLALGYLNDDEVSFQCSALWTLGFAYQISKAYDKAKETYSIALKLAKAGKDDFRIAIIFAGLGNVYEAENQMDLAYKSYMNVLEIAGKKPLQYASEAHLGLSRIYVHRGDLELAESHAIKAINLSKLYDKAIDRFMFCEVQLANVKLAKGTTSEAITILLEAEHTANSNGFKHCLPMVVERLVAAYIQNDNLESAKKIANKYQIQIDNLNILIEKLTTREIEILELIEKGLSNREIGEKLYLALDTVKGHNRRIFEKLQVSRRTEAVSKAKELNIV